MFMQRNMSKQVKFLDCTLRDGGYYNSWDFSEDLISQYLNAIKTVGVNIIEIGLRSLRNNGFKGACAYSTDDFLDRLIIPNGITVGVMVNACELMDPSEVFSNLKKLFPSDANNSRVSLVRIACHFHEFEHVLPVSKWLKDKGYNVGFNLMQVTERSEDEVKKIATEASLYPLDVLYFADSLGSMKPEDVIKVIKWIRSGWDGEIGIHAHDNLGLALSNSLAALGNGCQWIDSTVTGMGRGPGNTKTEELAIELAEYQHQDINLIPMMSLINEHFKSMQRKFGWGTNPYYYLAGKYSIHPSYIQEMLKDPRYDEEDLLATIEQLKENNGSTFTKNTLDRARYFFTEKPSGSWCPESSICGRDVLIVGPGPGAKNHRMAIESFVKRYEPFVVSLNTIKIINSELVDIRTACHPVRLITDVDEHLLLPEPLVMPFSMLPKNIADRFKNKKILDFGIKVIEDEFIFSDFFCCVPSSLVAAYALSIATSGGAKKIFLAGFDGHGRGDPRTLEMQRILDIYRKNKPKTELISITPTCYNVEVKSIYAF